MTYSFLCEEKLKYAGLGEGEGTSVETVEIYTEFIRLQDFLKLAGAVQTGGEAKVEIQNGAAAVNGEPCPQRGRKLRPGDTVSFRGKMYRVGREDCRTLPPD